MSRLFKRRAKAIIALLVIPVTLPWAMLTYGWSLLAEFPANFLSVWRDER
jgi:hypothetical protein